MEQGSELTEDEKKNWKARQVSIKNAEEKATRILAPLAIMYFAGWPIIVPLRNKSDVLMKPVGLFVFGGLALIILAHS